MPDLIDLIQKWWKQMLLLTILSVAIVGFITFLKPKQYLAVATAVPASSFGADRSRIFNENVQALYSTLGLSDDLDMIVGTAQLDTVYIAVANELKLDQHFKMKETGGAAIMKATAMLKKNTRVMKSEYGELKVKVWDKDKNLAAPLANAIMDKLQSIHQHLQSEGNRNAVSGLRAGQNMIQDQIDSLKQILMVSTFPAGETDIYSARINVLTEQRNKYEKLVAEYELMIETKPPVLISVEKARVPEWPDRPKKLSILVATAVLAFLFSLLAAILLERRKLSVRDTRS
jgi:uncharacterized protein involved in exopolysaccharide biosynthesis